MRLADLAGLAYRPRAGVVVVSQLNPDPLAVEARRIAKAAGLVVFEVGGVFQVVRKLPDGRSVRLGSRSTPAGLRAYVCKLARTH